MNNLKIYKAAPGLLLITDNRDSVILSTDMVSVSYNGGCSFMMPKDEFDKHWRLWEQWTENTLLDEAAKLIEDTKQNDPFKGLTISFTNPAPKKTKKRK